MLRLCALSSGSSGNALFIESEETRILVDAGISARELTKRLACLGVKPYELSGILITHEHSDHIRGLQVFTKKNQIPVYCTSHTWKFLAVQGVSEICRRVIDSDGSFSVGDLEIEAFPTPHDAADPVGYCVTWQNSKIGIATDLGYIPEYLREKFRQSQMIFLEANHDVPTLLGGKYPHFLKKRILGNLGHLSNDTAAELLAELAGESLQAIVLGHLSRNNNTPEMALSTVQKKLANHCKKADNIAIHVCRHGELGEIISI
jgi:phosphoribosyl 1,2-cyclic phosphodiesterase